MGEEEICNWIGYPWNATQVRGLKFCSSFPQLFDYVNDPKDLVDGNGVNVEANAEVRRYNKQ